MPEFKYSFQGYDPLIHVRASGREVDISPKDAREVCVAIKGMKLSQAKSFLENVINLKQPVAFRRYKGEVGHKRGLQGFYAGRYPVKAAKKILEVLNNLEANAEYKGMDIDRLVIIHAAAMRGRKIKAYIPRAFGRATPSFNTLVHLELVAKEV
ncbi:MAG: 50S ribosomal protein L22 [Nitrososphaerota archaeon]|nr:50S ribosomal protein L22 [Nitrososphaerales archaeon]MCX8191309.1 50S ribosomal protein L22 [Nitrososphaerales archaeon]MDW8044298.1 50S ribosomal protein L22 [Nitrososphaerota archaeon]